MKRWIKFLAVTAVTVGGFSLVQTTNASASSYHKGTPVALRGYWRSKMEKVFNADGTFFWGYTHLTIKKNYFREAAIQGGAFNIKKLKYRYAGNHTYYLKGKSYVGRDGFPFEWKIKKVSARKFKITDLEKPATSYRTWYKFSGKIAKQTYYPYP